MSALFCLGKPQETLLYARMEAHLLTLGDVTVKHDQTQSAFVRKVQFA